MGRLVWVVALGWVVGCGAEAASKRGGVTPEGSCVDGEQRPCACAAGATGVQRCSAGWQSCECPSADAGMGFDNAPKTMLDASTAVGPTTPTDGPEHCDPGFYLGTYECPLLINGLPFPLMGDVSFNLEINEEVVECDPADEFCADLVIAEGSGTLFGIASLWGFEAPLSGGLDCGTGEFRTEPLKGVWGTPVSSDPNDPNALWTVQQPPMGMFDGELSGNHLGALPQVIEGSWNLTETGFGANCTGTFNVQLQP